MKLRKLIKFFHKFAQFKFFKQSNTHTIYMQESIYENTHKYTYIHIYVIKIACF